MEERKFVCKYCKKRFPCGKSLGGHIRTHMTEERSNAAAAADSYDHAKLLDGGRKRKRDSLWPVTGVAGGGGNNSSNLSYGLRENPKKTTRFVNIHDAATVAQQEGKERFCKECGKGFPSLKALCGHMACHSEKDKGTNYRFERFEDRKLVMDDESDTENCSAPRRSKRRMRLKTLHLSDQPSVPLGNGSPSSVSEVEQSEEDVAMLLMMLSRDSRRKGRFASVTESSDNNSVVLEARPDTRIAVSDGKNAAPDDDAYEVEEEKKLTEDLKLKRAAGNSDSAYFRYESESRKMMSRSKYTPDAVKNSDYDRTYEVMRKRASYDSLVYNNLAGPSGRKTANGFNNGEIHENHESLASEFNSSYDSIDESGDKYSTDTNCFPAANKSHNSKAVSAKKCSKAKKKLKSKKSMEHECPICYRIFQSGQALGGHKRSHFIGGSGESTLVIKQAAPVVSCLIDLNLPAPADD